MELPIQLLNVKIINAGDVSSNITSSILEIKEAKTLAVQAIWSGSSPSGTLSIKGSCDGINFVEISSGSMTISGNSGSSLLNIPDCGYAYLEAVYTATSGSGSLTVIVNAKRA